MRKVCVVGGGTAGVEAALEAAISGARVTLLERSSHQPIPRVLWPQLLDGCEPESRRFRLLGSHGVEVDMGMTVASVGLGGRVATYRANARFDSVVIATGSRGRPVSFPGWKKPGVHVLATCVDYLDLAAGVGSVGRSVVSGNGIQAFQVADGLRKNGADTTLLGRGFSGGVSQALGELLEAKASEAGIRVLGTHLQKAVGVGRLEAVVAGGRVVPCETLAIVTPRSPDLPAGPLRLGSGGGLLVDGEARTSELNVFAAGSCAELSINGSPDTLPLGGSAVASGRAGGANSAGRRVPLTACGTFSAELFGTQLDGAGITFGEARRAGLDAAETVNTEVSGWACSLVHDRSTGRLLGAQLAGPSAGATQGVLGLAISQRLTIGTLANSDIGNSTDISVLQDTARQGLAWS